MTTCFDVQTFADLIIVTRGIPLNGQVEVALVSDGCHGSYNNEVRYLEHVEAKVTMQASRRGEIQIFLISPRGTRSTLLARRSRDLSTVGFNNWAFMTTHNWGEPSQGTWTLEIHNGAAHGEYGAGGSGGTRAWATVGGGKLFCC